MVEGAVEVLQQNLRIRLKRYRMTSEPKTTFAEFQILERLANFTIQSLGGADPRSVQFSILIKRKR
jgi:hypothetical protein